MKPKKAILLFLALLFPGCIFVFLKYFGRNEFNVPPLYTDVYPEEATECNVAVTLPYHLPKEVRPILGYGLTLIHFGETKASTEKQMNRVMNEHGKEIILQSLPLSDSVSRMKKCVFFLKDKYDLVLVDNEGTIRGEYVSEDREEMDRLITELSILLKKY